MTRSRHYTRWRIGSLVLIHLFIGLHLLLYYRYEHRQVGSIDFQELFRSFLSHGRLNAGAIFVLLVMAVTAVWGRVFCGWACHFGALQELAHWLLAKAGIRPRLLRSRLAPVIPLALVALFYVLPALRGWSLVGFPRGLRLETGSPAPWALLPGPLLAILTLLVDGVLLVLFLGSRGFCRLLCPWGWLLSLVAPLSRWRVRQIRECHECGACSSACPVGIDVRWEIARGGAVLSSACEGCLTCVETCPNGVLAFAARSTYGRPPKPVPALWRRGRIQLPWPQEVLLVAAILGGTLAFHRVGGIGLLLAGGLGTLTGLALLGAWRALRGPDLLVGAMRLRRGGRLKAPGWVALAAAALLLLAAGYAGVLKLRAGDRPGPVRITLVSPSPPLEKETT